MSNEFQKCLVEGSYITLTEAGHDSLRYVGGGVLIVTIDKSDYISSDEIAKNKVKEFLNESK